MIKATNLIPAAFLTILMSAWAIPSDAVINAPVAVKLVPYSDPWPSSLERWWDINNNPYSDWITGGQPNRKFAYRLNPQVTLTYDTAPNVPFFVGHLEARGLKPNFAYQLKLIGKPVYGTRGMGTSTSYVDTAGVPHMVGASPINGDDWTNQQIGYAGRWWDDDPAYEANAYDSDYQQYYLSPAPNQKRTIYGYQVMDDFVTDPYGSASVDFTGQYSNHVSWASWQNGSRDAQVGTFPIQGGLLQTNPSFYYAYGSSTPTAGPVALYLERQSDRSQPVRFPGGLYHVRFLLTEESFHNLYGGTNDPLGGLWRSVLVNEDFGPGGQPDLDPSNDVVFSIAWRPVSLAVTNDSKIHLAWNDPDSRLAFWIGDNSFHFSSSNAFGPYTGWTAASMAAAPGNHLCVLWTNTDGRAAFWSVDNSSGYASTNAYGPYTGWTARALSSGPEGSIHLLWNNTDGSAALWTLDSSFHPTNSRSFGPYSGWTASGISTGPDGITHLLWTNSNGSAALWSVDNSLNYNSSNSFGPYPGWTARSLSTGPDNRTHILWANTNGSIAFWTVDSDLHYTSTNSYGPYPGWIATSLTTGGSAGDPLMYVLWNNTNGSIALWQEDLTGNIKSSDVFGPYY